MGVVGRYLLEVAVDADGEDRDVATGSHGLVHKPSIDDLLVLTQTLEAVVARHEVLWLRLQIFVNVGVLTLLSDRGRCLLPSLRSCFYCF